LKYFPDISLAGYWDDPKTRSLSRDAARIILENGDGLQIDNGNKKKKYYFNGLVDRDYVGAPAESVHRLWGYNWPFPSALDGQSGRFYPYIWSSPGGSDFIGVAYSKLSLEASHASLTLAGSFGQRSQWIGPIPQYDCKS
jgi:hypothetical protein